MTNYVLLNHDEHKGLRVIDSRSAGYGDDVMFSMTFPFEFRNIQSCYPIFFHKDQEKGTFSAMALFGFENGENLFLSENGWSAPYIPLMIRRQPFLIGFQHDENSPDKKKAIVSIDMDSPRVSSSEGQTLFEGHGGSSDYLIEATKNLEMLSAAHEHGERFISAMTEHELIEPFSLDIKLNDGSENQLLGFYTVNEDKLHELDGETLETFNKEGFLQPIYMILASHSCIQTLVDFKNKKS